MLLLLRSRFLSAPSEILQKLTAVALRRRLSPEDLSQALQQMYILEEDGSKTILVPYKDAYVKKVNIKQIPAEKFASDASFFPPLQTNARSKPNIDSSFLRQLRTILFRVAFPRFQSKETAIVLHSFFLVLRTVLSIAVAKLDGRIVRDLVSADGRGFVKGLVLWFFLAIPSTYTNSMIRHLQAKLALLLRTRLTRYAHDLYLSSSPDLKYYRSGLEGVDQYLTADIESWSESLAGLYGNLLKSTLDIVLFTSQLSRSLGVRGTLFFFANYYITASVLRAVTPAFGRLAAVEARLEGEYRAGVGRVGRDAEEVAFYDGGAREKDILIRAYMRLIKHINSIYKIRIAYEWTEDFVIKYLWSAVGYGLIAVPLLYTRRQRSLGVQTDNTQINSGGIPDNAVAGRTETYISNRRLLHSLADAGSRLMYSYKDLLELAGLSTRVYTLLSTLHNLSPPPAVPTPPGNPIELSHVDVSIPRTHSNSDDHDEHFSIDTSPPLVRDLSLIVRDGEHLMITGSNGVGKTSVARVLAGLWSSAALSSSVRSPADDPVTHRRAIYVVPQRAYMVTGSLLDQMIYPHSYTQFVQSGRTEEELMKILEMVYLSYLPEREGGWRTRKEWRDVLSGGEKQRMALARVFYHRPRFAILDECTSAVSSDVEGRMYESAKALGITLITISLRPSLMKYHTQVLTLAGDGTGSWTLAQVGTAEERMGIDREIISLEEKLAEVGRWEKRVKELGVLLSVQEGTADNNDEDM